jgi:hypothetical protein
VLLHISNRYLEIEPVLGNIAADLGLLCTTRDHVASAAELERGYSSSHWVALARTRRDLGRLGEGHPWRACEADPGQRVWTDDYSSPVSIVKWG